MAHLIETLNLVPQDKIEFHNKSFDKLSNEYDRFYIPLRTRLNDLNTKLSKLQEAEDNYYTTAKYLLDLASRVYNLFEKF